MLALARFGLPGKVRRLKVKIHGAIPVSVPAMTKINRQWYGLEWNAALETGGLLVGDDVAITIDVEFIKA